MSNISSLNAAQAQNLVCSVIGNEPSQYYVYMLCQQFNKINDEVEDLKTNLYITAGVLGGACLLLFLLVIILFVKLNYGFKHLYSGDVLEKRGFSTYTGAGGHPLESVNPTYAPSPPPFSPNMPVPNYNAGGVRVLPRNPPPLRPTHGDEKYY